jgi:hypothetical protein
MGIEYPLAFARKIHENYPYAKCWGYIGLEKPVAEADKEWELL